MDKKLNIAQTDFQGLAIIETSPSQDPRGSFSRIFCSQEIASFLKFTPQQINISKTKERGCFRGLHFQHEPYAEAKLITCLEGAVYDIAVDIRKNSPTFLKSFAIELNDTNNKMILIPKGFAHGFQTLSNNTMLLYLHSNTYSQEHEGALNIHDPLLDIQLPTEITSISNKDSTHKFLSSNFLGVEINEM